MSRIFSIRIKALLRSKCAAHNQYTPGPPGAQTGYVIDPFSIYLNNLPYEVNRSSIIAASRSFGPIQKGGIKFSRVKKFSGKPGTAYGSVMFTDTKSAIAAVKSEPFYMNGKLVYIKQKKKKDNSDQAMLTLGSKTKMFQLQNENMEQYHLDQIRGFCLTTTESKNFIKQYWKPLTDHIPSVDMWLQDGVAKFDCYDDGTRFSPKLDTLELFSQKLETVISNEEDENEVPRVDNPSNILVDHPKYEA
ncbi:hypothetical protein DCAR_0830535 [Daucus carota subsp. sativus]|uniref:RRM domain-containing protein n=1 Tax=Daucus carota subsp. sativus TaxID=79200 RepID=A0A175YJX1_DAUCS|nr:hypothetical protein DCAR_0830535 [Daucus carota subsp. sativus]